MMAVELGENYAVPAVDDDDDDDDEEVSTIRFKSGPTEDHSSDQQLVVKAGTSPPQQLRSFLSDLGLRAQQTGLSTTSTQVVVNVQERGETADDTQSDQLTAGDEIAVEVKPERPGTARSEVSLGSCDEGSRHLGDRNSSEEGSRHLGDRNSSEEGSGHLGDRNSSDDVSGHLGARNSSDDVSGHPSGRNSSDDVSGHLGARNSSDDVSGHLGARNSSDDVSGHPSGRNSSDDVSGHLGDRNSIDDVSGHSSGRNTSEEGSGQPRGRNSSDEVPGSGESPPEKRRRVSSLRKSAVSSISEGNSDATKKRSQNSRIKVQVKKGGNTRIKVKLGKGLKMAVLEQNCGVCLKSFKTKTEMNAHIKSHNRKPRSTPTMIHSDSLRGKTKVNTAANRRVEVVKREVDDVTNVGDTDSGSSRSKSKAKVANANRVVKVVKRKADDCLVIARVVNKESTLRRSRSKTDSESSRSKTKMETDNSNLVENEVVDNVQKLGNTESTMRINSRSGSGAVRIKTEAEVNVANLGEKAVESEVDDTVERAGDTQSPVKRSRQSRSKALMGKTKAKLNTANGDGQVDSNESEERTQLVDCESPARRSPRSKTVSDSQRSKIKARVRATRGVKTVGGEEDDQVEENVDGEVPSWRSPRRRDKTEDSADVYEFDEEDSETDNEVAQPSKRRKKDAKKVTCETCGAVFNSAQSLKRHIDNDSHQFHAKNYACCDCFKEFRFLRLLRQHRIEEHNPTGYSCSICRIGCSGYKALQKHLNTHDAADVHVCDVCSDKFTQKPDLDQHRKAHFEESHTCGVCGQKFANPSSFAFHRKTAHVSEEDACTCSFCGKKCKHRSALKTHEKIHTDPAIYKCDVCDREFKNKDYFNLHKLKNHSGTEPLYSCEKCPKRFYQHEAYFKHISIHDPHIRCQTCGIKYRYENQWIEHEKLHEVEQPFGCSICKRVLFSASMLKSHMGRYHSAKLYECEECSASFVHSNALVAHRRTHTGEKPFKCQNENCFAAFARKDALRRHEQNHLRKASELPFKFTCDICQFSFKKAHTLYLHKKSHNADHGGHTCGVCELSFQTKHLLTKHQVIHKLYKCDKCPAAYGRKTHLKAHYRKHTKEKPFSCSICGDSFARSDVLKRHREQVHPQTTGYRLGEIKHKPDRSASASKDENLSSSKDGVKSNTATATAHEVEDSEYINDVGTGAEGNSVERESREANVVDPAFIFDQIVERSAEDAVVTDNNAAEAEVLSQVDPGSGDVEGSNTDFTIEFVVVDSADVEGSPNNGDARSDGSLDSDDDDDDDVVIHREDMDDTSYDEDDDDDDGDDDDEPDKKKGQEITANEIPMTLPLPDTFSENPYERNKCPVCSLKFAGRSQLKNHYLTHTGEKPFSCQICSQAFNRKFSLDRHMKKLHENRKVPLEEIQKMNLLEVETEPSDKKASDDCSHNTGDDVDDEPADVENSAEKKPRRRSRGRRDYQCSHCDRSYSRASALKKHERIEHGVSEPTDAEETRKKKSKKKKKSRESDTSNPFQCSDCGETFNDEKSVVAHRKHHTSNPLRCGTCRKTFSTRNYLALHIRRHTGDKPFTCDQCDAKFSRRDVLERHRRNKHTAGVPVCILCHVRFRGISGLEKHLKEEHNGAKLKL